MSFDAQQSSAYGGAPVLRFHFYAGTRSWRYTNQGTPIVEGSETFSPLPISMGGTSQSTQELPPGVEITLPSSDPLTLEFKPFLPAEPIEVEVSVRHRTDSDSEWRPVFVGEIGSCDFNDDGTATLTCYTLEQSLERTTPWPTYCTNCNWAVFSAGCGVNRELFKVEGTVDGIDGNAISVSEFGAKDSGWFAFGHVVRELTGEVRWVVAHDGSTVTLVAPFLGLGAGEKVIGYAGCDGLEQTCKDKFDNLPNHAGFPDMPEQNPFTDDIFGTRG